MRQGAELYRDMPWRTDTRPYYVLVSELMLQQTQVERVIPKFTAFITAFPDEYALAKASLAEVLTCWQGLGYNRRAKFLHDAAKKIVAYGTFPDTEVGLMALPGVGANTAGAIMAYAFNQPALFIETNIRTVYFYHFFTNGDVVDDTQVRTLLKETLDQHHPREFYWSVMDYGAFLKRSDVGRISQSKQYKKQSPLKGSVREVRGHIVHRLVAGDLTRDALRRAVEGDKRFDAALQGLLNDGLVTETRGRIHLTK